MNKFKSTYSKIILISFFSVLFIIVPFANSIYTDDVYPEKITSDLAFYEVNTCSISLVEFITKNVNVIFQDHYKIVFNNYSSIRCFGRITGIDQINHKFYISIGTNVFINIFFQSFIWLSLISLFKKDRLLVLRRREALSIILSALLFTIYIFVESRYYAKNIYLFDLELVKSYQYLFVYLLFINFLIYCIFEPRKYIFAYLVPYLFIVTTIFSGLNFSLLSMLFLTYGILTILSNRNLIKFLIYISPIVLIWSYQALSLNYYLDPDKIRGFITNSYNFSSVLFTSFYFIIFLIGALELVKTVISKVNYYYLSLHSMLASSLIFILGYLASSNPAFNFFFYYFFGLPKYPTDNSNILTSNQWGEIVSWRGIYPSAESLGELAALSIILFFLFGYENKSINKSNIYIYTLVPLSLFTLYLSNNRTAFLMLVICFMLKLSKELKISYQKKFLYLFLLLTLIILTIGYSNILNVFNSFSTQLTDFAVKYSSDFEESSSVKYIEKINQSESRLPFWVVALSQFAFLINRSEIWAVFFARYNPDAFTLLFGSGPLNLSKHYSEVNIISYKLVSNAEMGFLLPHSSYLVGLIYFGLFGLTLIFTIWSYKILKLKKTNYNLYIVNLFLLINLIKSDSLLYIPSFIFFLLLIMDNQKYTSSRSYE